MKDKIIKYNIYSNTLHYYIRNKLKKYHRNIYSYAPDAQKKFENVINEIPSNKIMTHISLSPIKQFSPIPNPYRYLKFILTSNFSTVIANAFTPQVKKTKIFDPKNEKPFYGAFSKLFFEESEFRNIDPLYSICGMGELGFDKNQLSLSKSGIFKKMIDEEYYCLNIGLRYFTSSTIHLIEIENKLPYINIFKDEFMIKYNLNDEMTRSIKYIYYNYSNIYSIKGYIRWNKKKIINDLKRANIWNERTINGVIIYYFNMKLFYEFITEKINQNQFYLVTW